MTIKASNFPTTRPSLDLNFAQTKRLDPRVTFSRASSGTYTDVDGLIKSAATNVARFDHNPTTGESLGLLVEEARTNYAAKSFQNFSITHTNSTLTPNNSLAPDNTFTAALLNGAMEVTNTGAAGNRCFSLFIKKVSGDVFNAFLSQGGGDSTLTFTFSTETITNPQGSIINIGYTKYPNGWYRIYGQLATTGSTSWRLVAYSNLSNPTNGQTILIWGHQDEVGSFPTSIIPTPATFTGRSSTATFYDSAGVIQTAASGVARSNAFLPDSSGVMRPAGLLLEGAATNLVTYSAQFDQWGGSEITFTTNTTTAPDGTSTADKIIPSTVNNNHRVQFSTAQGAGTFTFSVYAKAAGYPRLGVRVYDGTTYQMYTTFDVSAGTIVSAAAGTARIESVGNGWYRCSCTGTTVTGSMGSSPAPWIIEPLPASATVQASFAGDGTSGTFLWGAQIEAGSYATSYIPTVASTVTRAADTSTSATVTRSADVAQITGTNFSSWYNQSQGTIASSFFAKLNSFFTVPWLIGNTSDGLNNNYISLNWNSGGGSRVAQMYGSSVGNAVISLPSITATPTLFRNAFAVQSQNCAAATNGVFNGTSTAAAMPPSINTLYLSGQGVGGGGGPINGTISRFTYWPTRLSDATLQAITR